MPYTLNDAVVEKEHEVVELAKSLLDKAINRTAADEVLRRLRKMFEDQPR